VATSSSELELAAQIMIMDAKAVVIVETPPKIFLLQAMPLGRHETIIQA
jgi:hypothetical protein